MSDIKITSGSHLQKDITDIITKQDTVGGHGVNGNLIPGNGGRLLYVDGIRALAIVGVVAIHVTSPVLRNIDRSDSGWWVGLVCSVAVRIAVPLFVIISGLLLLDPEKDEPLRVFFKKRLLRVVVPFIAWAVAYLVWITIVNERRFDGVWAARQIIEGPVYTQFWFIYMLLGLYLATPVLRVYTRHVSRAGLLYFLILWYIAVSVLPFIHDLTGISVGIAFAVTTGFTGYFVMGHYFRDFEVTRSAVIISLVIAVACFAITLWLTAIAWVQGKPDPERMMLPLSLTVVPMAAAAFIILKSLDYRRFKMRFPRAWKLVRVISGASFSIYLMHLIPLETLAYGSLGIRLNGTTLHPSIGIPLTTIVIVGFCVGVTVLIRKVPGMKWLFP